jgi:lysophospholipase L1-like esterase
MLESLVVKLERSNQQLLSLTGEQSQEIRRLREDIATSKRQDGDADSNDGGPQAVTLLVGNSLLRDVRVDKTSSGNPIKIRRKSGATLADIQQMIDDAAKTETIDEIFIVGGTHERTSDVSSANIKENVAQLLRKAKTLTPTITVSSVLPSKRRANPDRRADVNMKMKETCNEVDVKFVDNDANFTFRNGAADDAAFQRDGLHLSESGVGRLLLNLSLPEQPPKHNKRQQHHRHV